MPGEDEKARRRAAWVTFAGLGVLVVAGLLVYPAVGWLWDRVLAPHPAIALSAAMVALAGLLLALAWLLFRRRRH